MSLAGFVLKHPDARSLTMLVILDALRSEGNLIRNRYSARQCRNDTVLEPAHLPKIERLAGLCHGLHSQSRDSWEKSLQCPLPALR
jgi:hypothetical protein